MFRTLLFCRFGGGWALAAIALPIPMRGGTSGLLPILAKSPSNLVVLDSRSGVKVTGSIKEEDLRNLNAQMLEMVLTCHGTFDVDPHHLRDLLERDEDIAAVTECSVIIHDRCPIVVDDLPASVISLLYWYRRLSCILEPFLRQRILEARNGLDRTVGRFWAGYVAGSQWTALKKPSERWLVTETSSGRDLSSMQIHYNLLEGILLVNGSLLTRLPGSYEPHPTFRRLLGEVRYSVRKSGVRLINYWAREKIIDVGPSTMSGMVFEARDEVFNQRVSMFCNVFLSSSCALGYVMTEQRGP